MYFDANIHYTDTRPLTTMDQVTLGISTIMSCRPLPWWWKYFHRVECLALCTSVTSSWGALNQHSIFRLSGLVEVDEAFIGGKRSGGKFGRGAEGKTPVLVAVESRSKKARFIAMEATPSVSADNIRQFAKRKLLPQKPTRTDDLAALRVLGETQQHEDCVTPAKKVYEWLPWVHIATGNLKSALAGYFPRRQRKISTGVLGQFVYRFNQRLWEGELPMRLLNSSMDHRTDHFFAENGSWVC